MHGKITELVNQGTIIQVMVVTDAGRLLPVNFDHRMFRHLVEGRGARSPEDLIGQGVTFELDEIGEVPVLSFDDEEGEPQDLEREALEDAAEKRDQEYDDEQAHQHDEEPR